MTNEIKLLILDVDGVLTNGAITYTSEGHEIKSFHVHDGLGMKRLMQSGVEIAIITSRKSTIVEKRMNELGVKHLYQGQKNKLAAFEELLTKLTLTKEQVAYCGDDLPDLVVMEQVALPIAVANAVDEVKAIAKWQTQKLGGQGAVREICERLLLK